MPRAPSYYDDWQEILGELEAERDRGAAIVGAALLETKLREAITLCLVPDLSPGELNEIFAWPLGTISNRAKLAYGLGLIGEKAKADLLLIAEIRNKFAHRLAINSFGNGDVTALCSRLALAEMTFMGQEPPTDARGRFVNAVVVVAHLLYSELVAGTPVGEKPSKSL